MASQIQYRGGTTAEHTSFTGAAREITVDTTKKTVVVHDGVTAGGFPVMGHAGNDKFRLDADGNACLGATPSAWHSNRRVLEIGGNTVASLALAAGVSEIASNLNIDSTGAARYVTAQPAGLFNFNNHVPGGYAWLVSPQGAIGGVATLTQAMALDASGDLSLEPKGNAVGDQRAFMFRRNSDGWIGGGMALEYRGSGSGYGCDLVWKTNAGSGASNVSERMRLDASGNLLVGATSGSSHTLSKSGLSEGNSGQILVVEAAGTGISTAYFFACAAGGVNTSAAATWLQKNSTTSRSINAAGTVNASGADYAEYMRKAEDCGQIAKGQVVGVNANGHLTDKWADSVSFLIKSTDPSYVGGDVWGSEDALGMARPVEPQFVAPQYEGAADPGQAPTAPAEPDDDATDEQIAAYVEALEQHRLAMADYERAKSNFEQDRAAYAARVETARQLFDTATYPTYLQQMATFAAALEAARQKVDRIAFSGQVPVNALGAVPGQYVVPVQDGEGIGAVLVNEDDMTLRQYMRAVGIVQNILPDGRANVRVKVA